MRARLPRLLGAALLAATACLARSARADDPPPPTPPDEPEAAAAGLDEKIKGAIEHGVRFLRSQQRSDGSWGDNGAHGTSYGGGTDLYQYPLAPTAMALYAMLKCDVPATDPAVKSGFAWLKKVGAPGAFTGYEVSAMLLAVTATADPFKKEKDRRAAGSRVKLVGEWRDWATSLQTALLGLRGPRGWRYQKDSTAPGGREDVSSTQLAVLALAAADRCGVPTDGSVYADAAAYLLTLQEAKGPEVDRAVQPRRRGPAAAPEVGGYAKPKPTADAPTPKDHARGFVYSLHKTAGPEDRVVSGSRTACGVGALALARWALDGPDAQPPKKGGRPAPAALEQAIYDGLAWLSQSWDPWENPGGDGKNIYYLYCVERAMDLTGADRLGDHLWYLEMVERLLPQQHPKKGYWDTHDPQVGDRNPVIDTSLALLFLRRAAKGGVPVPIVTGGDDVPPPDTR